MELARAVDLGPEALNCSAPDTGNMEILAMFGTPEQQAQWLGRSWRAGSGRLSP